MFQVDPALTRQHEATHVATALWMGLAVRDVDLAVSGDGAVRGVRLATAGPHPWVRFAWGVFLFAPELYETEILHQSPFAVSFGCAHDAIELTKLLRQIDPSETSHSELNREIAASARHTLSLPVVRSMIDRTAAALSVTPQLSQSEIYALWDEVTRAHGIVEEIAES
jgi:hypothetical protein